LSSSTCTASTTAYNDQTLDTIEEINGFLEGSLETLNGNSVGSILGARACVSYDSTTEIGFPAVSGIGLYTVVISWQAMDSLVAPTVNCANGLYGTEAQRQAASTTFRAADLF